MVAGREPGRVAVQAEAAEAAEAEGMEEGMEEGGVTIMRSVMQCRRMGHAETGRGEAEWGEA